MPHGRSGMRRAVGFRSNGQGVDDRGDAGIGPWSLGVDVVVFRWRCIWIVVLHPFTNCGLHVCDLERQSVKPWQSSQCRHVDHLFDHRGSLSIAIGFPVTQAEEVEPDVWTSTVMFWLGVSVGLALMTTVVLSIGSLMRGLHIAQRDQGFLICGGVLFQAVLMLVQELL